MAVVEVRHRLEIAGTTRQLFPASPTGRLYRLGGGVPRVINVTGDRELRGAFVQGKEGVDSAAPARTPMPSAEFPLSIQGDVPKLSISFRPYSGNPGERPVGIDNRMLHEGDSVEPGS